MTATFTATQIIQQNGYVVTTDFTPTNVEYWIDDSVDYVNLLAETSIPHMTGTAGSKSISVSDKVNAALKPLLACVLRENKKTTLTNSSSTSNSSGSTNSFGLGALNGSEPSSISSSIGAASSINNPNNTIFRQMFLDAIERLRAEEEYDWNKALI